ncbi:MAG: flagellar biosynthesis protein FlhF, partial [Oceanisphaera sp.]|nr:flagellar biosynthesis protein FlhF [Oceanisphaera sp.]
MKIKRFFAKDMRAALAEVKDVLGADAVIMSNKKVSGGIEIVAAVDDDETPVTPVQRPLRDDNVRISSQARQFITPLDEKQQSETLQSLLMRGRSEASPHTLAEQSNWKEPSLDRDARQEPSMGTREPLAPPQLHDSREHRRKEGAKDKELNAMRQEIASIRRLLEHQVSGLMWQEVERREPVRAMLIKHLNGLGFSDGFADQLAMMVHDTAVPHEAWNQIETALCQQLMTGEDDILRQGGAVALLGPT